MLNPTHSSSSFQMAPSQGATGIMQEPAVPPSHLEGEAVALSPGL